MIGGRLRIVNESRYAADEVEHLVRFGLQEIDLTGENLVAIVKNTRRGVEYSGHAYHAHIAPETIYQRYIRRSQADYLIVMRLGPPECFPIEKPSQRNGNTFDYMTWQEALVAITAHEGMHAQHYHDRVYGRNGGRRVGSARVEPKCEAHELLILRRYRELMVAG